MAYHVVYLGSETLRLTGHHSLDSLLGTICATSDSRVRKYAVATLDTFEGVADGGIESPTPAIYCHLGADSGPNTACIRADDRIARRARLNCYTRLL